MKNCIGSAAARAALAAIVLAAVTAAAMMAAQPARAQEKESRVVVHSLGSAASLGVNIRDVTGEDAVKAKMGQPTGVYIDSVRQSSPAAKANIQAGDIVVEFDGERVRSASHLTRLVQESVPNRQVPIVVVRGTNRQTLNVVPEEGGGVDFLSNRARARIQDLQTQLPRDLNFNFDADALRSNLLPLAGGNLGVTVSPLSDQLASYFGVTQGVLVSAVANNSPAASAGIRAGDVITAVNGQNVSSSGDITRALRENRGEAVDINLTREKKPLSLKATVPGRNRAAPSGRRGLPV